MVFAYIMPTFSVSHLGGQLTSPRTVYGNILFAPALQRGHLFTLRIFMILGLTGAFGGGKSTVLSYFAQRNWHTFDADSACHKIYASGERELLENLKNIFGLQAVRADGSIDRRQIAAQLFASPEKKQALSDMLYPRLNAMMNSEIDHCRKNNINGVFELPLLYEAGFENSFDAIMAIWSDPAVRAERLAGRNFSADDMKERDRNQLDPFEKLERADFAVINNGSKAALYAQLDKFADTVEKK